MLLGVEADQELEIPVDPIPAEAEREARLTPSEAVEDYHEALRRKGLRPWRDFGDDREITESVLRHG